MTEADDATKAQIRAAKPDASTWVVANAGSGKTRVLTDRVARLLLHGTEPQKILCLTYTKAAASEMQNRLFERLGEWAMMEDAKLREALTLLGEEDQLADEDLRTARRLFANALETPGGLKIQTIHSFCDKLLRRFPLEAGVSPQFEVLEDRQAKLLRAEILEELALGTGLGAVDRLARFMSGLEPDALLSEIASKRKVLDIAPVRALLAVAAQEDPSTFLDYILGSDGRQTLREVAAVIRAEQTNVKPADNVDKMIEAQTIDAFLNAALGTLMFKSGAKALSAKVDALPTQGPVRKNHPSLVEAVNDIAEPTAEVYWLYVNHLALERAEALAAFSDAFLARYDQRKLDAGRLDYDDLIARAGALLSVKESTQWVLYKLDGGIDHVLVDEAQDTSPSQWDVVKLLTDEFTSGDSGQDTHRTVFVVGDEKQSIYSFQGADPAEFDVMRQRFSGRLAAVGQTLAEQDLAFSFRSADPILRLVDKVFDGEAGAGFRKKSLHRPFFTDLPGRVDLWPFEEKVATNDETPWFKPVDTPEPDNPQIILAKNVADWIAGVLASGQELPGKKRAIQASDFLILVQGRRPIFHNIIKELKARDLPVAGADRLNVGQELAVRDVLSLLKFADLPEDDLSLAEALRSPLLGFSEDDLFWVAHRRGKQTLWQNLRDNFAQRYPEQIAMLISISNSADFLRPYELIERIMTRYNGRANILARLGLEAEDGIDELLSQAMRYEQLEAPSLPGFLNWFAAGNVEIKREMDAAAGQIRVMTVHGAKGLEAPIVILPDTEVRGGNRDTSQIMPLDSGGFLWKSPKDMMPKAQMDAGAAAKEFAEQERMRLLYVALTRAEQWLVVAGAGNRGKEVASSWYNLVSDAMEQNDWMPVVQQEVAGVGVCSTVLHNWSEEKMNAADTVVKSAAALPDWAGHEAPTVAKPPAAFSPSSLDGAKAMFGGDGVDPEAAMRKGRQVHLLLEHLAKSTAGQRRDKARQLLVGDCAPADEAEFEVALGETQAVLGDPDLAYLFAPDTLAEVRVSAEIPEMDGRVMDGIIDRLIVTDDRVLIVDFKTNFVVPETAEQTPIGVLRQLGAYRSAVLQIYPDRGVDVAVLWTATRQLMTIDHDIVMQALQSATTS
jgi:ATP-dependent helicase/nuclease subunit A